MAQQIISADQLVPKFQGFRRCNNYAVLQNIPCSPECKIVGHIILDHPLSYALTAIADVPTVYLQQFWKTVSKLYLPKERTGLHLAPIGHLPLLLLLIRRRRRRRRGSKLLENKFTKKITQSFHQTKEESTTPIPPPSNDRERDEVAKTTLLSLSLHKTTIAVEAQENVAKVQEKLEEEEKEKMVEGKDDDESYASEFPDLVFNDNDDSSTRIKPESHNKNPEIVDDDDETEKEKKDEKKDDIEDKDNDDQTDHTLARPISNKSKILPRSIPGMCRRRGLIRTHLQSTFVTNEFFMGKIREVLDHCNTVVPELTFARINEMLKEEIPRLVNQDREIVPKNVPELVSKEFADHAPVIIAKLFQKHMQNTTLNLYPATSSSTDTTSTVDIQHQLYLTMKSNPQDQAANPELWDILKAKEINRAKTFIIVFPEDDLEEKLKRWVRIEFKTFNEEAWLWIQHWKNSWQKRRVLKEVKLKIKSGPWKKLPLLGELDLDILKAYVREISKRLRHRVQMGRWESFVNGIPILPAMRLP
ncbi:hypothetical protein Tco_0758982 [Tanacetum coccineum]